MSGYDIAGRIGHDLKSVMAPIRTSAYVLRQGERLPEATQRDLLEVLDRQILRLAKMLDETVDWQRAMAGTLVRRIAAHDVATLLDLVAGALPESPEVSWPPYAVPNVRGDGARLEQMLVALIGYCARRDPSAPAQVEIRCDGGVVRVTVSDRGPEVDLDALLTVPLFDPPDAGLGLGLLLAQAIARAHHGELVVVARDGGGICFECSLPQATGTEA